MSLKERVFYTQLLDQLKPAPAWTVEEPACAAWLDGERRLHVCTVRDHRLHSPLWRVSMNTHHELRLKARDRRPAGLSFDPRPPAWRFELICQDGELTALAGWLAELVARREGQRAHLPPPPFPLLNWSDPEKLDAHLYYMSSASLWSEAAFVADLHEFHARRPHRPQTRPSLIALKAA